MKTSMNINFLMSVKNKGELFNIKAYNTVSSVLRRVLSVPFLIGGNIKVFT